MTGGCYVNGTCFFAARRASSYGSPPKCPGGCYDGASNMCKYPYDPRSTPEAVRCLVQQAGGCFANGKCYLEPLYKSHYPIRCMGGCADYYSATGYYTAPTCVYHANFLTTPPPSTSPGSAPPTSSAPPTIWDRSSAVSRVFVVVMAGVGIVAAFIDYFFY
jgi:hypothetical protein